MGKVNIKDLNIEEIEKIIYDINQEKYRGKQIFKWIYRGVCSFDEMTDIPLALREKLKEICKMPCLEAVKVQKSVDGTQKFLFKLDDGNAIESVLMKYKYGHTACISTQVGCKMGCKFCASAKLGCLRNLSAGEIVGQILAIQKYTSIKVSKVVYMGIGEPLDNYDNVIKSLYLLNNPEGLNIGFRNISVSTCGIVPKILRLAQEKIPVTLSISLHASNNEDRNKIMPINSKYNIDELLNACKEYFEITKRRISFEYVMIENINDSEKNARELSNILNGTISHVNLIQLNKSGVKELKRSPGIKIKRFIQILEQSGMKVTLRRELGSDIDAACGQLRLKSQKNNMHKDKDEG